MLMSESQWAEQVSAMAKEIKDAKKEVKELNYECSEYEKALGILRDQLAIAINSNNGDICCECGCTEFLCGHNKRD